MVERVHIAGMEPGLAELGSAAAQLEMSAFLQLPLSGPCAGARQDAAPPEVPATASAWSRTTARTSGGAASSRAGAVGARRDTPPSERGVARPWMGCPLLAEGKRQGPRRGEYCGVPSRQVQLHTGNKRGKPFADGPCGSMHPRPPAVLPPPPFPFAPKPQSRNPLPPGGTPLSEGGGCLRTLHSIPFRSARPLSFLIPCAVARQDAAPPEAGRKLLHGRWGASGGAASSRAGGNGARRGVFQRLEKKFPIIGKNGAIFPTIGKIFSNHWKNAENFFQSLENRRKIFPIVGKFSEGVA